MAYALAARAAARRCTTRRGVTRRRKQRQSARGEARVAVRAARAAVQVARQGLVRACMVKGGEIGGFGGGWLKHLRRRLGAQWPGLLPCVSRAAQSRRARPEEAQEPSWGAAQGALRPCCRAGGVLCELQGFEQRVQRADAQPWHLVRGRVGVKVRVGVGIRLRLGRAQPWHQVVVVHVAVHQRPSRH